MHVAALASFPLWTSSLGEVETCKLYCMYSKGRPLFSHDVTTHSSHNDGDAVVFRFCWQLCRHDLTRCDYTATPIIINTACPHLCCVFGAGSVVISALVVVATELRSAAASFTVAYVHPGWCNSCKGKTSRYFGADILFPCYHPFWAHPAAAGLYRSNVASGFLPRLDGDSYRVFFRRAGPRSLTSACRRRNWPLLRRVEKCSRFCGRHTGRVHFFARLHSVQHM
jgi:hypothetical protein